METSHTVTVELVTRLQVTVGQGDTLETSIDAARVLAEGFRVEPDRLSQLTAELMNVTAIETGPTLRRVVEARTV